MLLCGNSSRHTTIHTHAACPCSMNQQTWIHNARQPLLLAQNTDMFIGKAADEECAALFCEGDMSLLAERIVAAYQHQGKAKLRYEIAAPHPAGQPLLQEGLRHRCRGGGLHAGRLPREEGVRPDAAHCGSGLCQPTEQQVREPAHRPRQAGQGGLKPSAPRNRGRCILKLKKKKKRLQAGRARGPAHLGEEVRKRRERRGEGLVCKFSAVHVWQVGFPPRLPVVPQPGMHRV